MRIGLVLFFAGWATSVEGAPTIDFAGGTINLGTKITLNVTTTLARDTLMVILYSHDSTFTGVDADSGVVPGGFTRRSTVAGGLEVWTGFAPTAFTNVGINGYLAASAGASIAVLAFNGIYDATLPFFDANGALPVTAGPNSTTGQHVQITTTNTDNILVYACGTKGPFANIDNPTGWTSQAYTNYAEADLRVSTLIVNSAQTNLDVNPSTSDAHETVSMGDAVNGSLGPSGVGIIHAPLTHW